MKNILLLTFLFFAFSCSSDDNSSAENEQDSKVEKKLITVNKDGNLYMKIYYDSEGKTIGNDRFENGALDSRVKIEYTQGLPVRWNYYDATSTLKNYNLFTFQGNLIVKKESYVRNSSSQFYLSSYLEYVNDSSKKINNLISTKFYNSQGKVLYSYNITYTDDLGSNVSDYFDAEGNKTSVNTWVKDDKIAWDKVLDPFTYQHEHNNISVSSKNLETNISSGSTRAFTYDKDGYPLTAKYVYTSGDIINYTFVWE